MGGLRRGAIEPSGDRKGAVVGGREGRAGGWVSPGGAGSVGLRGPGVLGAGSRSWDALGVGDRAGCGESPIFAETGVACLREFESYRTWKSSGAVAILVPLGDSFSPGGCI